MIAHAIEKMQKQAELQVSSTEFQFNCVTAFRFNFCIPVQDIRTHLECCSTQTKLYGTVVCKSFVLGDFESDQDSELPKPHFSWFVKFEITESFWPAI